MSYYSLSTDTNSQLTNEQKSNEKNQNQIETSTSNISKTKNSINSNETREIETLTDICSSDNIAEVDVISLLDEKIPQYKLRADTIFSHSNCDWIRAPLYIDENEVNELTNEQIAFTLDYFIQSGYRVSQMTKTYYDIEAVTKLLEEKERDLELAAVIGKHLVDKSQEFEEKIEYLERELEKTTEMVNQLKYQIQLKDNLLKIYESDQETLCDENLTQTCTKTTYTSKRVNEINLETLHDFKRKIEYLEDENDKLRNRAEYYQKETADLESKESSLIQNCFKELEDSQATLRNTQNELKHKTAECVNQKEEIDHLFAQIFELQARIKTLNVDNQDLHSIYESSKIDLLEQIRELKEKYNECIQMLSKSQEELSVLRRKTRHNRLKTSSQIQTPCLDAYDDDDSMESSFVYKPKSTLYSPFMPVTQPINNTSFAAEVYSNIKHISQSNNFVKRVKQKLIKTIPGTSTSESCFQSEDEINLSQMDDKKFLSCPTPDSILSTGSASIFSTMFRSSSFFAPEKLQIVKPIEGSQTLQHWQYLATPNLGCLFENRPGISIKGNSSDSDKDDDKDSLLDELEFDEEETVTEYKNRILSPNKLDLLTKLLEKEEKIQNEPEAQTPPSLFGMIKNMFFPIQEKSRTEYADPDTPPSSPINLPNNKFVKLVGSISNYFKGAPTPPATPTNELEIEEKSLFDQIVDKLSLFKPKKYQEEEEEELICIEENKIKCSTPPPSPSKFSPPLANELNEEYTEEDLKKSAFATVTKLNPLLNQQVDLSSLLRSLSSLKRNQRLGI